MLFLKKKKKGLLSFSELFKIFGGIRASLNFRLLSKVSAPLKYIVMESNAAVSF